eukprot:m.278351 g.278351  ORF g.278351 m.278351 type:complete len:564 (+) comp54885_c0_seq5:1196-2887(+)
MLALRLAVLVLSALVLRVAQGIDNELLLGCQSSFNDDLDSAIEGNGDQCQPYIDLNTCLTSVIVGAPSNSLQVILSDAESIVVEAMGRESACDLHTMSYGSPSANVDFAVAAGEDVQFTTYNVMKASALGAQESIKNLAADREAVQASSSASIKNTGMHLNILSSKYPGMVDSVFSPVLTLFNTRITGLVTRATNLQASANSIVPTLAAQTATLSTALASEASTRTVISGQWTASMAPLDAMISTRASTATAARTNLRNAKTLNSPLTSITSMFATQTATENSRSTSEASSQTTAFTTLRSSFSTVVSTSLSTEQARLAASCSTKAATVSSLVISSQAGGTNDDGNCTLAGTIYYSLAQNVLYICNGAVYVPFLPAMPTTSCLSSSGFMNANQQMQLAQVIGRQYTFVRCYYANVDGWSSSTMHTRCDGKTTSVGTLIVYRNNYGWTHGGWYNSYMQQRGGYYTYNAFTFRFSPFTANNDRLELLYPIGYSAQYATYESSGYCGTFGGGHDTYVSSNCQTGYTYMYTYMNPSIGVPQYSAYVSWYTPSPSSLSISYAEVFNQY